MITSSPQRRTLILSRHLTNWANSSNTTSSNTTSSDVDILIIGAGFGGLYMTHKLKKEQNTAHLNVAVLETGSGVGGTWFWNRYPGARCDVPSVEYSFSNDAYAGLEQDWTWSEHMAGQPEIEKYANYIADKYALRQYITFTTRVESATYAEEQKRWHVKTDTGRSYSTKFLITACGCLSAPNLPKIYHQAVRNFTNGPVLHTSKWPKDVSLHELVRNKRVGVVGTGSSGIQSIPEIAKLAQHLTVFQRTPQYTLPAKNHPLTSEYVQQIKARYSTIRQYERESFTGMSLVKYFGGELAPPDAPLPIPDREEMLMDLNVKERQDGLRAQGFDFVRQFIDVSMDPIANETMCELYREHLKTVVRDPAVAEGLSPRGYPLGCKRQVLDSQYFETFNRSNVTLVDLRNGEIDSIDHKHIIVTTPTKSTSDNTATNETVETVFIENEKQMATKISHELDLLIFATGFDAMSGPLVRLNLTGKNGMTLKDLWKDGPESYMGIQISGFPNLFTITGPGSPSVLSNMIVSIEQHVDFIADMIHHVEKHSMQSIECDQHAQDQWCEEIHVRASPTMLMSSNCSSWYLGSNISGKPRKFMIYLGVGDYRQRCDEIAARNFAGFFMQ